MNNEQKTLLKLLEVKTMYECKTLTEQQALDRFMYFLTEFKRLEA